MHTRKKRLIVGMSGASGAPIGIELLRTIKAIPDWESHLVITDGAAKTINYETDCTYEEIEQLADYVYNNNNIGAAIASGTFRSEGMVIVPCSMKTVAGIACGYSDNLLLRAADVTIKEGRKLALIVRESPVNAIHLKNMTELSKIGVIIMPAVMTFYNRPLTIEEMTKHIVGKALDRFDIELEGFKRWGDQ